MKIRLDLKRRRTFTPLTGPSATSQDFLLISWLWSVSLATSLCDAPADGLKPGGDAESEFLDDLKD